MSALMIREDLPAGELRRLAKAERDLRVARRLLAIAAALEGLSRGVAARVAGMDRQTLRDWVIRYNRGGPAGLSDERPYCIIQGCSRAGARCLTSVLPRRRCCINLPCPVPHRLRPVPRLALPLSQYRSRP
jgi:hypothetical protein